MDIPAERLSEELLLALAEEFVTREGTDYGEVVHELDDKVADVLAQVHAGRARIVWDPATETFDLVPTEGA